jgi:CobQ-like glutamine amidotransferase family enzyme
MKRIFISFAIDDENLRDLLKGQARNENSPFEFVDMSVKQPWDSKWKTNCRTRIRGCDGVISIVTKNTKNADGQIWEMNCAKDERIPIVGIYGNDNHSGITIPSECGYIRLMDWTWDNISNWIEKL